MKEARIIPLRITQVNHKISQTRIGHVQQRCHAEGIHNPARNHTSYRPSLRGPTRALHRPTVEALGFPTLRSYLHGR